MEPLWADLINSDWHDYLGQGRDEDRLEKPEWVREFLARWELPTVDTESEETRLELRDLRSLLRRLASKLRTGRRVSDRDLSALNAHLASGSVVRRIERRDHILQMSLTPATSSLEAVLSEIAASFADMLVNGDPTRIRVCENQDCRWVIYDRSKNRTRRWCEGPTGCGNLIKVRRHRERKRQQASR
jgi:predicted RNA-binding Zn ribbon-like protein